MTFVAAILTALAAFLAALWGSGGSFVLVTVAAAIDALAS